MARKKVKCDHCDRVVGVRKDGTRVRHKKQKGSKDQTRCLGGGGSTDFKV